VLLAFPVSLNTGGTYLGTLVHFAIKFTITDRQNPLVALVVNGSQLQNIEGGKELMAYVESKGLNKKGQAVYRIYYDAPKNKDGTRNQKKETYRVDLPARKMKPDDLEKWITTKGKDKAMDHAKAREKEVNTAGYKEPTREKFPELSERWLEFKAGTSRKGKKQPKTMLRYKELLARINEFFENDEVAAIDLDRVEEFYKWLSEQPKNDRKGEPTKEFLSQQTQWHHHRCLYSVLQYAVERELLSSNPCKFRYPETPDQKDVESYTEEEVVKIKELLEGESLQNKVLVSIALEIGARAGEIQALKWADINFDTRMVSINKSWQYIPGEPCFEKVPKNKSSIRDVKLSASTIFLLRQLKGQQEAKDEELGTKWVESGAVFVQWNGAQIHAGYASSWWPTFIKDTKLPVKNFHCLRHTCISLLLSKGAPVLEVAHMVGHSDASMIWKRYGHAIQKAQFEGASIMEGIMNKIEAKSSKAN
jgi:integrase